MLQKSPTTTDALSRQDRNYALLLGLPAFALALCLTTLSTYLPVLAHRLTTSTALIGVLVGGEGFIAVLLPIWVGRMSDRVHSRWGRRLPFLIATAPVAALALAFLPFAPTLSTMAAGVFVFYVAYFTYFSPYRALYPDLISESAMARSQGINGVFNGAGLGVALVGGGFLLAQWLPLPYVIGAVVLVLTTIVVAFKVPIQKDAVERTQTSPWRDLRALVHDDPAVLRFVIGNALLTLALGGLKSFVVLWLTQGLGKSMTFTAGAMTVVAVGTVVGALISGKLGDKYGSRRVLTIALGVFGAGVSVGAFSTSVPVLAVAFPFIALAGGAAIALPYPVLLEITPAEKHGLVAGVFDASSGIGTILGPMLTGLAIDALRPVFPETHGFAAMWPVLSVSTLVSAAVLWKHR